ncbi:hypothetical protein BC940DRAFT_342988 [Gongronella butleri]|nr:hypothetical protein BC940DRAFT_342988 [Gongronella butleri]
MYVVMPTPALKRQNAIIERPSPFSPAFLDRPGSESASDDDDDFCSDNDDNESYDSAVSTSPPMILLPSFFRSHDPGDYDPPSRLGFPPLHTPSSSSSSASRRRPSPRTTPWPPPYVKRAAWLLFSICLSYLAHRLFFACFQFEPVPTQLIYKTGGRPSDLSHFWAPIYKPAICKAPSYVTPVMITLVLDCLLLCCMQCKWTKRRDPACPIAANC